MGFILTITLLVVVVVVAFAIKIPMMATFCEALRYAHRTARKRPNDKGHGGHQRQ